MTAFNCWASSTKVPNFDLVWKTPCPVAAVLETSTKTPSERLQTLHANTEKQERLDVPPPDQGRAKRKVLATLPARQSRQDDCTRLEQKAVWPSLGPGNAVRRFDQALAQQ